MEIGQLISQPKRLPDDYRSKVRLRPKRGHSEQQLDVVGDGGSQFRLLLRQSLLNPLDFSVILAYQPPGTFDIFRLRRYNGLSHQHTNTIEKQTFYDFHIHEATQRYQELGESEDTYASPIDRYADLQQAIACMLTDCGFILPATLQPTLF